MFQPSKRPRVKLPIQKNDVSREKIKIKNDNIYSSLQLLQKMVIKTEDMKIKHKMHFIKRLKKDRRIPRGFLLPCIGKSLKNKSGFQKQDREPWSKLFTTNYFQGIQY